MPYSDPEKQLRAQREHYARNKEQYVERNRANRERVRQSKAKRRERIRQFIDEAKNRPCADCGQSYPSCVMDFDHCNDDKVAAVSKLVTNASFDRIKAEIAKCEVVCANCHRMRTLL